MKTIRVVPVAVAAFLHGPRVIYEKSEAPGDKTTGLLGQGDRELAQVDSPPQLETRAFHLERQD